MAAAGLFAERGGCDAAAAALAACEFAAALPHAAARVRSPLPGAWGHPPPSFFTNFLNSQLLF